MYQLRKKVLPIELPSMVEAENFSNHQRISFSIDETEQVSGQKRASIALFPENPRINSMELIVCIH
jgi:hypothetical protein